MLKVLISVLHKNVRNCIFCNKTRVWFFRLTSNFVDIFLFGLDFVKWPINSANSWATKKKISTKLDFSLENNTLVLNILYAFLVI